MPWKKGESGNRAGRKPGTRNRRHAMFESKEPELKKKLINMALGGDTAAMKIIADRIWPKRRSESAPVRVKVDGGDLASKGRAIIDAALSGKLTPDVLRDLLSALADQARLVEFTEIEERLNALEQHREAPPWEQTERPKFPIRGKRRRNNYESKSR